MCHACTGEATVQVPVRGDGPQRNSCELWRHSGELPGQGGRGLSWNSGENSVLSLDLSSRVGPKQAEPQVERQILLFHSFALLETILNELDLVRQRLSDCN